MSTPLQRQSIVYLSIWQWYTYAWLRLRTHGSGPPPCCRTGLLQPSPSCAASTGGRWRSSRGPLWHRQSGTPYSMARWAHGHGPAYKALLRTSGQPNKAEIRPVICVWVKRIGTCLTPVTPHRACSPAAGRPGGRAGVTAAAAPGSAAGAWGRTSYAGSALPGAHPATRNTCNPAFIRVCRPPSPALTSQATIRPPPATSFVTWY